jgi:hypothetical protein
MIFTPRNSFHVRLPATPEVGWKAARLAEGTVHDKCPEQVAEPQRHFPAPRAAVSYILNTFPNVKRKDKKKGTKGSVPHIRISGTDPVP